MQSLVMKKTLDSVMLDYRREGESDEEKFPK